MINIKTLVDAFVSQVDFSDFNLAADINNVQSSLDALAYSVLSQASFANVQTLSGALTLTDDSAVIQLVNPNSADRDVNLPALDAKNHPFYIYNTNGSNYLLTVKNSGGTTIRIVPPGKGFLFISDGNQWVVSGFDIYKTITPTQISANQNDYNPTGAYEADIMRLDASAAYNITGFAGGSAGRVKILMNVGSYTITLKNEDANSTAANRLSLGSDFSLETLKAVLLIYDATSSRWRMIGGGGSTTTKGRVEFLNSGFPATDGASMTAFSGGSTPAEQVLYWAFANSANQYREFLCKLVGYNGGGLTFTFLVNRTSASAGETYIFEAAIQRIVPATTNLTSSKSYAYNAVTVTVPAGPPNAGIPMLGTITFTDGADMDSLADGEFFILRFRRDVSDTATDVARVLAGIAGIET